MELKEKIANIIYHRTPVIISLPKCVLIAQEILALPGNMEKLQMFPELVEILGRLIDLLPDSHCYTGEYQEALYIHSKAKELEVKNG